MSTAPQGSVGQGARAALIVGLFALAIAGCHGSAEQAATSGESAHVAQAPVAATGSGDAAVAVPPGEPLATHLTPDDVRQLLKQDPDVLVLDVRQPEEWNDALGHIDGAKQIPLPDLPSRIGELEAWRNKPIVTVCRSGRRSEQARQTLANAGFTDVGNMDGGMLEWRKTEAH